jgi:hypothetical protein
MNGANWSDRYPLIIEAAVRIKGAAILDAEVVCLDEEGHPQLDRLHNHCTDDLAVAWRSMSWRSTETISVANPLGSARPRCGIC